MPDFVEKAYGYHIYFWSNEGEPLEPLHFHISYTPHQNATKIWIMNLMALKENVEAAKGKWLNHFGEISYYDN